MSDRTSSDVGLKDNEIVDSPAFFTTTEQLLQTLKADFPMRQLPEEGFRGFIEKLIEICKGDDITYRIEIDNSMRQYRFTITSKLNDSAIFGP